MSGIIDITVGRIKEAAGVLADNKDLREEGKVNQADGKAKEVEEVTIQASKDTAKRAIDKAKSSEK